MSQAEISTAPQRQCPWSGPEIGSLFMVGAGLQELLKGGHYHDIRATLKECPLAKTGWILTALVVLFLLGASVAPKFLQAAAAVESLQALSWSPRWLPCA